MIKKEMLKKISNLVVYGGLERKQYLSVRKEIYEYNRKNIFIFATIGTISYSILAILSYFYPEPFNGYMTFLIPAIGCALTLIIRLAFKNSNPMTKLSFAMLLVSILSCGIYASSIDYPSEASAIYPVFVFIIPAIFLQMPIYFSLTIILGGIVNIAFLRIFAYGQIAYDSNIANTIIFSIIGMVSGMFVMSMKIKAIYISKQNKVLMECDVTTGLLNRRSFNEELLALRDKSDDYSILMFDVNGLKTVNDRCGHKMGDLLLVDASKCIESVFGPYGKTYRIGGDEFAAIISWAESDEKILTFFSEETKKYSINSGTSLTISIGIARKSQNPEMNPDELFQLADKLMYADKAKFYENKNK